MGPAIRTLERPRRARWWLVAAGLVLAAIILIPLIRGIARNRQAAPEPGPTPAETTPAPQTQAPAPAPAPEPQAAAPAEQPAAPPAAEQQQAAPPMAEEQPAAPPAAEQQQAAPPMGEEQQAAPSAGEEPQAAAPAEAPAEPAAAPAESSVSDIAAFLGSNEGSTPRTFTLAPLTYAVGQSSPSAESMQTVDDLAETLGVYPSSEITLVSHTDSTGSRAVNNALAEERSESVKALLVERGVEEGRITTQGQAEGSPVDTNATSEGRANNRRTDVIVTER